MQTELDSFDIRIDQVPARSSTTIGSVGAYVLAVITVLPDHAYGLTSCYLGGFDGAVAVSHLRSGPDHGQRLSADVLPRAAHAGAHARACLLDHAAELQQTLVGLTGHDVRVDVPAAALDHAIDAWGPRLPDV